MGSAGWCRPESGDRLSAAPCRPAKGGDSIRCLKRRRSTHRHVKITAGALKRRATPVQFRDGEIVNGNACQSCEFTSSAFFVCCYSGTRKTYADMLRKRGVLSKLRLEHGWKSFCAYNNDINTTYSFVNIASNMRHAETDTWR